MIGEESDQRRGDGSQAAGAGSGHGTGARPRRAAADPPPTPAPGHDQGHGRRLTAAFEALEAYPVLVESRNRVLRLFDAGDPPADAVVAAVESDVALTVTVVRLANQLTQAGRGRVDSVVAGVQVLTPAAVQVIASRARTFDFFERGTLWHGMPERFRLHAVATQRAAAALAGELDHRDRDRLMVSSLLHDIGKLVLVHAYPGYPDAVHREARTPEQRVATERDQLGVDHAMVGGVLARRWALPNSIAGVIERHHSDSATGEAALVRLADMLAHHLLGGSIDPAQLLSLARAIGLGPAGLRRVMYELPLAEATARTRQIHPCPLSIREVEVLRRLARGMVYKQIASDLELSASTVRTHLHNVYGKLGAMDRAQAVLIATERGWI